MGMRDPEWGHVAPPSWPAASRLELTTCGLGGRCVTNELQVKFCLFTEVYLYIH
jgi:hypothetical protein